MIYPDLRSAREALEWCIGKLREARDCWKVATDKQAPPLIRAAARQLVVAGSDARRYTVGKDGERRLVGLDPECGRAFDRIADRLDGKPVQSVHVHRTSQRTPAESIAALEALMARNPALASMLAPRLAMLAPSAAPTLDAQPLADPPGRPPNAAVGVEEGPPSIFQPIPDRVAPGPSSVFQPVPEPFTPEVVPGSLAPPSVPDPFASQAVEESAVLEAATSSEPPSEASESIGPVGIGPASSEGSDGDCGAEAELSPRERVLARRREAAAARRTKRRVEMKGTEF